MKKTLFFKFIESVVQRPRGGSAMKRTCVFVLLAIVFTACAKGQITEDKQMLSSKMMKIDSEPQVFETHDGNNDMDRWCIMGVTIRNKLARPILGTDYQVYFDETDIRTDESRMWSEKSKNILPHDSITYKTKIGYYYDLKNAYVKFTISNEEIIKKYFTPTSNLDKDNH